MEEFNSNDHYIDYCGQKSLRRNGVALTVNKRVWNKMLECNIKNDRMILVHFQGKPLNITVMKPLMLNKLKLNGSTKIYDTFRTNTEKKDVFFHHRQLEYKNRKSGDTQTNRQVWPWNTKWSRAKLTEFYQENMLVIANTDFQQHKRWLSTWTSPQMVKTKIRLILFFAPEDGEDIYSHKKQPGDDCSSDHELLIAKSRWKLKKVGKTTRGHSGMT